jgi:hypothetical protein
MATPQGSGQACCERAATLRCVAFRDAHGGKRTRHACACACALRSSSATSSACSPSSSGSASSAAARCALPPRRMLMLRKLQGLACLRVAGTAPRGCGYAREESVTDGRQRVGCYAAARRRVEGDAVSSASVQQRSSARLQQRLGGKGYTIVTSHASAGGQPQRQPLRRESTASLPALPPGSTR